MRLSVSQFRALLIPLILAPDWQSVTCSVGLSHVRSLSILHGRSLSHSTWSVGRSVGHFGRLVGRSHGRTLNILQGWSTYEGCRLTDRPTDHLTDSDWPSVALISAEIAMPHTLYLARFSSFNILLQSWNFSLTFLYSINKQKVNAQ